MLNSHASERLSAEDAVFFYLDTKDMPLHIAAVMIFDGPLPLAGFRDLIHSKLALIPRYRQRIVVPPFNAGHPTWEWDPAFDIRKHVRSLHLKRGTEAELQRLVARILSEMMDRNKPLWDMTLVDGLHGGRGALIARVHHCLVDGMGGIGVLNSFFDPTPQPPPVEPHGDIRPLPDAGTALVDALLSSYSEMFDRLLSMQSAVLNLTEGLIVKGVPALELLRFVPELLGSVDKLPFNKPCPGHRKLVWTEVSLADVKAVREIFGGKLNDVVLTVVTVAIRRYTLLHHQPVKGRMLRMMVPMNIRGRDNVPGMEQNDTGNRVSMLPVIVPLDVRNPVKLLDVVRQTTEALKQSNITEVVRLAGNWVGFLPAPLQALVGPHASSLPSAIIPPWNMVCTNVIGPAGPLYALGREMLTAYPYVPVGAEMGLNIAIESYNGKLFFGFTGSEAAAPDVDIVPGLLAEAFAELRKAAGLTAPRQRPKPARRAKPSTPVPAPNGFHAPSLVPAPGSVPAL